MTEEEQKLQAAYFLLSKYGYHAVTTDNLDDFLNKLEEKHGIKAEMRPRNSLRRGEFFIVIPERFDGK